MADQVPLHAGSTVRDAVQSILRSVLPPKFHSLIPGAADLAMARPALAAFAHKRWIALSDSERDLLAREVGVIAATLVIGGDAPNPET